MRGFRWVSLSAFAVLMACAGDDGGSSGATDDGTGAGTGTTAAGDDDGSGDGIDDGGSDTAGTGMGDDGVDSGTDTGPADTGATGSTTDSGPPQVVMETTLGTIVIELYEDDSPVTVDNFVTYVEGGFYDGTDGKGATIFHRVIPGFVIQGGGLTEELMTKTTLPPIVNEASNGVLNLRGTLSMARTSEPDTATSQFFVNLVDNPDLDAGPSSDGYAVFGEVVEGIEVVDAIAAVMTTSMPPYDDVPVEPVVMTSVTIQ